MMDFVDDNDFAESTNLRAIPVIVTIDLADATSGIDLRQLRTLLNGSAFFDGNSPPATFPPFPRKLEVIVAGQTFETLNSDIVDNSAFKDIKINYHPASIDLSGSNMVDVEYQDKVENTPAPATDMFFYP